MAKSTSNRNTLVFTIAGEKEITRRLKLLPDRLKKKVLRQAMRASMKPVAAAVRSEVPVLSGLTKASVKVRSIKFKSRNNVGVKVMIGKGDYKGETYYAAFVQFGTSKIPADPFMDRAFSRTKDSAKAQAMTTIRAGIDREVLALAKS